MYKNTPLKTIYLHEINMCKKFTISTIKNIIHN